MKKLFKRIAQFIAEIKKYDALYSAKGLYTDPRLNLWLNMDANMPMLIM